MNSRPFQKQWRLIFFVVALLWPSLNHASDTKAVVMIKDFLNKYETVDQDFDTWLTGAGNNAIQDLQGGFPSAMPLLGDVISGDNPKRRMGAAIALKEILSRGFNIKQSKIENPDAYENLDKNLVEAFNLKDKDLQAKVKEIWKIVESGALLALAEASGGETSSQKGPPEISFNTSHFFLHSGAVILNPYTISKNDDGDFELKESGETDARVFIEAVYRNRYAWLGVKPRRNYCLMDYEMRLGWASGGNDPSGAVVAGAGDAYMEFSVGLIPYVFDFLPQDDWTFNIEGLAGFVTDKGAQDLHSYYGVGPVIVAGVPYKDNSNSMKERRIEVIGGVYFGQADKPEFADDETNEIKKKNDFPVFSFEPVMIWRGDIHFPVGKNGFVTIAGRFNSNLGGEDINPWNLAIGYTIPIDPIFASITGIVNQ